ncbi:hypothetical protein T440DRAFT_469274, partial [Plenodomus tracheiphilus IPT5]
MINQLMKTFNVQQASVSPPKKTRPQEHSAKTVERKREIPRHRFNTAIVSSQN